MSLTFLTVSEDRAVLVQNVPAWNGPIACHIVTLKLNLSDASLGKNSAVERGRVNPNHLALGICLGLPHNFFLLIQGLIYHLFKRLFLIRVLD